MKKAIILFAISLFFAAYAEAQSARRVPAQPTPTAAPTPLPYSESTPAPKRARYTERFPGIGDGPKSPLARPTPTPLVFRPRTTNSSDEDTVRVDTNLITIPVSVYDASGLYVSNLLQDNFKIFEDGKEQTIEYFGRDDKPFIVVLLIDTSLSFKPIMDEVHAAALAFVDKLQPRDSVMVIDFDGNSELLTEATNDRAKIARAIRKAKPGSGTSLYDSVDFTLSRHLNKIQGRKAVVLFTDGVDTSSKAFSYDTSLDLAEASDSLIFPIYYDTFLMQPGNQPGDPPADETQLALGLSKEEYTTGKKYLDELALYTGGRVFEAERTPGGLKAAFEAIAEELRRQYNIGYVPTIESPVGTRKQIRVRVNRPGLSIRARDNYIVGAATDGQTSR